MKLDSFSEVSFVYHLSFVFIGVMDPFKFYTFPIQPFFQNVSRCFPGWGRQEIDEKIKRRILIPKSDTHTQSKIREKSVLPLALLPR
jgi:hypothetical protein